MNIKNLKVIECSDWDRLVETTYGRPYCLQQQDDCVDRGLVYVDVPDEDEDYYANTNEIEEKVNSADMGVSFKAWLARDPYLKLKDSVSEYDTILWWHRNFYPELQMVANDLYKRKLLKAGKYAINIDW